MGVNKRLFLGGDAASAGQELRFDEFWADYDGQPDRTEFKQNGKIIDFNTYSEGHAVLNQDAQTSGKYYLEIKLLGTSGQEGVGVFNRSTNTAYDQPDYKHKNPQDANYGAYVQTRGDYVYIGYAYQGNSYSLLSLDDNDIFCIAVDVDNKTIWWGRRDGSSDTTITWNNGDPNTPTGGLTVTFVPSDVIVFQPQESSSKFAEFEVLDYSEMLSPPTGFTILRGAFDSTLTENET